jgi:hypothetical protein
VNTLTPRRVAGLFCLFAALAGSVSAETIAKITSLGDNTYAAVREAKTAFNRDTNALKTAALEDARAYCAEHKKELKVISTAIDKPWFSTGFASAKIIFMALDPGDPQLTRQPEPVATTLPPSSATYTQTQTPTGDLYTDLLKLDDLRKRGLLTDKEFERQKKKLLKRSK